MEMIDQNNEIVGSTTESKYYVRSLSTFNRKLLKPSASVSLHRHSKALVHVLPPEEDDSSISLSSQSEKPYVTNSCLFPASWGVLAPEDCRPPGRLYSSPMGRRLGRALFGYRRPTILQSSGVQEITLRLDLTGPSEQPLALAQIAILPGIDELQFNHGMNRLTVKGTVDPIGLVVKLRKYWNTQIVSLKQVPTSKKQEAN